MARESCALTLWTFGHVEQHEYAARVERKDDRHDLAGLIAYAHHDPKELSAIHDRFTNEVFARLELTETLIERARRHVRNHGKLIPIASPDA